MFLPKTAQLANAGILTVTPDASLFNAMNIYWPSIHIKMALCTSETKTYNFYIFVVWTRGNRSFQKVMTYVNLLQSWPNYIFLAAKLKSLHLCDGLYSDVDKYSHS